MIRQQESVIGGCGHHRPRPLLARVRSSLPGLLVVLTSLLPLIVVAPYLAPRLVGLDRLVTTDERD